MSWRDRAVPADAAPQAAAPASGWRARALPADAAPAAGMLERLGPAMGLNPAAQAVQALPKPSAGPSTEEAMGRGIGQGGTLGLSDELIGANQGVSEAFPVTQLGNPLYWAAGLSTGKGPGEIVQEALGAKPKGLVDAYRQNRDSERRQNAAAQAAHPLAYAGGEVLGGTAIPIPGGAPAAGLGLGMRLLRAGGQGAALGAGYGLGSSEADLTKGDVAGAAADTAKGAGFGAAGGVVGEGISSGLSALWTRARQGVADAWAAMRARQEGLKEKDIASALGSYRGKVQEASRTLEVLEREGAALPPGQTKDAINAYLQSPEAMAVREQVALNKLGSAPEHVSEMAAKKAEHQGLVATKDASVVAATNEAMRDPFGKHVAKRATTLLHRGLPVALTGAGALFGAPWLGMGLGTVMSLTQGAPGRTIKNMLNEPAVRKAAWEQVQRLPSELSPETQQALQSLARYLTPFGGQRQ